MALDCAATSHRSTCHSGDVAQHQHADGEHGRNPSKSRPHPVAFQHVLDAQQFRLRYAGQTNRAHVCAPCVRRRRRPQKKAGASPTALPVRPCAATSRATEVRILAACRTEFTSWVVGAERRPRWRRLTRLSEAPLLHDDSKLSDAL